MPLLQLRTIVLAGTPAQMGRAHGEALGEDIRAFADQRLRAAKVYLRERGIRDEAAFVDLGRRCLEQLKLWDRDGWDEHHAVAAGAGIAADLLYTACNLTDLRDVITLPDDRQSVVGHGRKPHAPRHAPPAEAEGCSAMLVTGAASASGEVIAGQTWDLNPPDLDFVVAFDRQPAAGPRAFTVTCAGCPSLIGLNEHGVALGTTNIKVRGARVGIPYLSLLHRALRARTREEAAAVISGADRAAAHTYWIADAAGALDLECTADRSVRRDADGALFRTNHCLVGDHQRLEGEPPSASSLARLARVDGALNAQPHSVETIKRLMADRSDGVDSVNRFAEDNQGTSTNACVIAVPARRELHACRGSADRGEWIRLTFA